MLAAVGAQAEEPVRQRTPTNFRPSQALASAYVEGECRRTSRAQAAARRFVARALAVDQCKPFLLESGVRFFRAGAGQRTEYPSARSVNTRPPKPLQYRFRCSARPDRPAPFLRRGIFTTSEHMNIARLLAACAAGLVASTSFAGPLAGWTAVHEVIGQTSTATISAGGNPLYLAPKPAYSGAVGILMNYGDQGSFVCSGSLIGAQSVLTAAHCVSDGTAARPLSTTVFFYGGPDDPSVYAGGPGITQVGVSNIFVNPFYTGQVIDQNDIAVLKLSEAAPDYAPIYGLSGLTDLTGVEHVIAGYGVRSDTGGSVGSNLGTGRLRYAGNRFDFRFGDPDFEGYFDNGFGGADVDNVWISDFDNGTVFRDGSCNLGLFEAPFAPNIFNKAVFSSDKYCDLGIGAFEGIGGGGDSGSAYFVNGEVAAVHSFALWYRDDESRNRFGQLKGAVSIYQHLDFIRASMTVPEPATGAMVLVGLLAAGAAGRRRRTPVAG